MTSAVIILSLCCSWSGRTERCSRADSMDTQPYDSFLGEAEAGREFAEGAQAHQEVRAACTACAALLLSSSPAFVQQEHRVYHVTEGHYVCYMCSSSDRSSRRSL